MGSSVYERLHGIYCTGDHLLPLGDWFDHISKQHQETQQTIGETQQKKSIDLLNILSSFFSRMKMKVGNVKVSPFVLHSSEKKYKNTSKTKSVVKVEAQIRTKTHLLSTVCFTSSLEQGRLHDRINCGLLRRGSDAKTGERRKNTLPTDQTTNRPTNQPIDRPINGLTQWSLESRARSLQEIVRFF